MEKTNKLIAEFMGYEVKHNKCYSPKYNDGTIAPMQFHKSWDWLMPVIHKCFDVAEDGQMSDIMHHLQVAEMGDTYDAVVEFIKNQND